MKRLVVGCLAHVDAGKTTLSEALLYASGAIRKLGRVDHKDAFLDTDAIERERGITIFAKQALLRFPEAELTLLDTPGHVDFSAETERTLAVLDYAVLVISGTDGVQSHTETLWRLLQRYRVPTFLFVNKMDLPGPGREQLLGELRARLSPGCTDFTLPQEQLLEEAALCDDTLTEGFLEGSLTQDDLVTAIARRSVTPCYFGSALQNEGVSALAEGLQRYTREKQHRAQFGARVFKISEDTQGSRLTHLVLTGGTLRVRDALSGLLPDGTRWSEKVTQMRIYSGAKYQTVEQALPGMAVAVTGLTHTLPGDGLGAEEPAAQPLLEPVLTYQVLLPGDVDAHTALLRLRRLEEEDPLLRVVWNEQLGCIHVQLMGQVQLEVLRERIAERFGMQVSFGRGGIVYKETICRAVEGVGHYEPLRHYAEVHLLLEPGAPGSGLQFATDCREDDLDRNWQRLVLTHLQEKQHLGVLTGAPVTDMKITLLSGRAHIKHTEGGDFRQATYRAVRQGLRLAGCRLLEPWYDFELELPARLIGRAMSDVQRLCGTFDPPETRGEAAVLRGSAPCATFQDYAAELAAYSGGQGRLNCRLRGYQDCHNAEQVIAAAAYDPDADLENPCDSVFCAHGAGFVVKWDRVYQHMHLPLRQARAQPREDPVARLAGGAAAYCGTWAEDQELLRIFERTYGPVKRDLRSAIAPAGAKKAPQLPQSAGKEYLLVDGYNIIFSWDDLRELAQQGMESARSELIHRLCNYQGVRGCELILVFDAYRVRGNPGSVERVHNIHVVYTREAETADMYIEKVAHELSPQRRVRVATSDTLEQLIVLGRGAQRISAEAFRLEVDEVIAAIRAYLQDMPGRR